MGETYSALLSPLTVGPFELRNRVLVTAHVPGIEAGGLVNDAYIAYQRARARGGAALQISGSTAVHRTGAVGKGRSLDNTNPQIVEGYKRLADAIHDEGGRFLVQFGHAAATVNDTDAGRPLWGPSPVASELVREVPYTMRTADIEEVVEAHAIAARRVRESGLDGVELLGAFGFLIAAFLSPHTNRREDQYGGSLQNRLRFAREVIAATREALGPHRILGLRMPGDERIEGGLDHDDCIEIAQSLAADAQLDYLNVIVGSNYSRLQRMEHWPPTPAPHGLFVSLAAGIKANVDIPVFTTGRVTDPAMANRIVESGEADMVGMTRAHISDPDLVLKLTEGRAEDIRPCVGANVCIAQATEGKPIRCFHNAMAARESEWGEAVPAKTPKHVVVIGGGPAGMEAARVAAERGHRVSLYERHATLGGGLRDWAKAPLTAEFGKTVDWYERQLTGLQVRIHRETEVTADALPDADALILATGSVPMPPAPLSGDAAFEIVSAADALAALPEHKHVVLCDEGGGRGGLSVADMALGENRLTVVSTDTLIGELVNPNLRTPLYKRFLRAGAVFRPQETLIRAEGRVLVTRNIYSEIESRIEDVDVLIDWRGNTPRRDLIDAAAALGIPVETAGDCVAPRQVQIAIAEGTLAARRL